MKIAKGSFLLMVGVAFLLTACFSSAEQATSKTGEGQMTEQGDIPAYRQLAEKRLQGQIEYLWNDSRSHVLCVSRDKTVSREAAMHSPTPFLIFDARESNVIFEDRPIKATIKWASDKIVHVSLSPGMVRGDEENNPGEYGYYFDIRTRQKSFQMPQ